MLDHLGEYGKWLVKYGKLLDKDNEQVKEIMKWYEMHHRCPNDPAAQTILMAKIDEYIAKNIDQPLERKNYD